MSTPSTATITVPPNHQYYPHSNPPYMPAMPDYHHHHNQNAGYAPPASASSKSYSNTYSNNSHGGANAAPPDMRRPVAATTPRQHAQPHSHSQAPSQSQSQLQSHTAAYDYDGNASAASAAPPSSSGSAAARKRSHQDPVDWERFFGGKPPKEIIVIDDDDDDDDDEPSAGSNSKSTASSALQPTAGPSHSSYQPSASATATATAATTAPSTAVANASSYHSDKRRKMANSTATATYDPVYNAHQQSYSSTNTHTPYYDASPRAYNTSADRNTSYNTTTAPTSLSSNGTYLDEGIVGQKRKRSTRQTAADQKKREVATRPDPYSEYVPPPKPPLKAKDVYVPVAQDRVSRDQKIDDEDGHYIVVENSELTERYSVIRLLGQGTFGKVVQAWDRKRGAEVAVKIIRSVQKYRDASRIELRVLSTLAQNDKHNRNKCIHLRDTFDFRNHICIVTDLLGQSVFDFLKSNQFVPFPSSHIQKFARQLFTSVAFLHDLNLIHTDLKPENILLVHNQYQTFTYNRNIPSSSTTTARSAKFRRVLLDPEIRLIDFGSATFDDEYHSSVVSTRHYRAPEIILNLGWSFPCDIWSIGCILVEFFTGDALFQTHDNLEHLAMMEAICDGPLDKPLIRQVTSARGSNKNAAAAYFKRQNLDYPQPETPRSSRKFVKAMKHLHETIPPHTEFNRKFLDLLKKIFVYDPKKRITAHQALQHDWFKEHFEDDGTEAEKIRFERERAKRVHTR